MDAYICQHQPYILETVLTTCSCNRKYNRMSIMAMHLFSYLFSQSISRRGTIRGMGPAIDSRHYYVNIYGGWQPGPWFNIKMSSYQYRKSHCGDKTVVRSSHLHNRISYTVRCHLYIESGPRSLQWEFLPKLHRTTGPVYFFFPPAGMGVKNVWLSKYLVLCTQTHMAIQLSGT